ncbi:hypothetical protein Tco_0643300 [Tanacetum coccineum]
MLQVLLTSSLCIFPKNFRHSTSNSGTLPSQTVTNPRQQINAITTRSGKALEEPSIPLVPTPVVSNPQKEPELNPETSTEKVQNPNLENTAHVPSPGEEDSIFMELPKPKAKKTRFLKMFKQLRLEIGLKDALVEMPKFNKWLSSLLRNKEKLEEIAITTVNAECSAIIMNKVPREENSKIRENFSYPIFDIPTRMTLELAQSLHISHLAGHSRGVVWICQILQEISQKRTQERMDDQEAKEIKAKAREIMPQPSTVNCKKPQSKPKPISIAY